MKVAVVGVVRTVEFGLRALIDSGADIAAIFSARIGPTMAASGMGRDYYSDLAPLAEKIGVGIDYVDDMTLDPRVVSAMNPDVIYVLGWPKIVPPEILAIAPCIGMHPSPLPRRRGGAPLNWQIIDGETSGAVSLLRLAGGIDDGDIAAQLTFSIGPDDYIADVLEKAYLLTYEAVSKSHPLLEQGTLGWRSQDHSTATYTRRRTPADGLVDWSDSAVRITQLVRGVSRPFPGAFTFLDGGRLTIWRARVPEGYPSCSSARPGEILDLLDGEMIIAARDYCIAAADVSFAGPAEDQRTNNPAEIMELCRSRRCGPSFDRSSVLSNTLGGSAG